jgi:hypothetical protein
MPAGRRTTKTKRQRIQDFQIACNRSGFTGLELLQIMVDWQGWRSIVIRVTDNVTQSIVNSEYDENDQTN